MGNNQLRLNHATMNAAIEEYVNKRLVGTRIEVQSVRYESDMFTVNVKGTDNEQQSQS